MSGLEIRAKYDEAVESYTQVHTREALEETRKKVKKWRKKLIAISPTFRQELEERRQLIEAKILARGHDQNIDDWMMNPILRKMNEMAKSRMKIQVVGRGKLICPECGDSDRGNKMNKTPYCFKCNASLIDEREKGRGFKIKQHRNLNEAQKRMGCIA